MQHITTLLLATSIMAGSFLHAQPVEKKEKKEIIIEKKEGAKNEKMVIEINGNQVTINGKPAEEYKGEKRIVIDRDIVIDGNRVQIPGKSKITTTVKPGNKALLGVVTEKTENGAKINSITPESGAEKGGLKEGDVITMINKTAITSPEELTKAIGAQKPGDEVDVTYLREGKTKKIKATLGNNQDFMEIGMEDFNFNFDGLRSFTLPDFPREVYEFRDGLRGFTFNMDRPKYGMSIQDDEDGKGVKVTEIETGSNAEKAGLKTDDIITEIAGKPVKNVDTAKEILASNKEEIALPVKITRNGVPQNITIKVPRKLKTADL